MAEASSQPLITYRGDSPVFGFTLNDSSGTPINVTGYTFEMTVDTLEDPPETSDPSSTEVFQVTGTIVDGPNGRFSFQPTSINTNQTPAEYFYDVSYINGTEKVTLIKSTLEIRQDIGKT
jgi:hypothetical protein